MPTGIYIYHVYKSTVNDQNTEWLFNHLQVSDAMPRYEASCPSWLIQIAEVRHAMHKLSTQFMERMRWVL